MYLVIIIWAILLLLHLCSLSCSSIFSWRLSLVSIAKEAVKVRCFWVFCCLVYSSSSSRLNRPSHPAPLKSHAASSRWPISCDPQLSADHSQEQGGATCGSTTVLRGKWLEGTVLADMGQGGSEHTLARVQVCSLAVLSGVTFETSWRGHTVSM